MGCNVISMRDDRKTICGEDAGKTGEFRWLADCAGDRACGGGRRDQERAVRHVPGRQRRGYPKACIRAGGGDAEGLGNPHPALRRADRRRRGLSGMDAARACSTTHKTRVATQGFHIHAPPLGNVCSVRQRDHPFASHVRLLYKRPKGNRLKAAPFGCDSSSKNLLPWGRPSECLTPPRHLPAAAGVRAPRLHYTTRRQPSHISCRRCPRRNPCRSIRARWAGPP